MPLVYLIGRHGSGKSSIGRAMGAFGFSHLSVGTLRRLARHNQFPADVPYSLMVKLKRMPAGLPMPIDLAGHFLEHARSLKNCVVDGFPASADHLLLLPADSVIALVWTPPAIREARLAARAEHSLRQWTPGRSSPREEALAKVLTQARRGFRVVFVKNSAEGKVSHIAAKLAAQVLGLVDVAANPGEIQRPFA